MRIALLASLTVVLVLASGCARTPSAGETPQAAVSSAHDALSADDATPMPGSATAPANTPTRSKPFPIKSTGLPPERVDAHAPPRLDTSCRSDADCSVKNVGNCCGAMPSCVNAKATPDPAAVKADCEKRGVMSTCGFKDIQSCSCVAGTCRDAASDSTPVAQ